MPLYEYQCESCGVRFERHQSFSDEPAKTCPECGGRVHRLIYPVGIVFKGKGFYVTDNRKAKSSTAMPRNEKTETSEASEKSETAKESKKKSESDSGDD